MSDSGTNRLADEESPYLQQHADNPVNWQPWDEQALAEAREREVPIFLSIGYSACHWCHVMEEESFEDEQVAALLNDNFVPIKVDREERPDLDRVYQTICQLVSGGGGWPLSAWLTPEGEPFYVGTYFPKEEKRGMPGFRDLLENISESWDDPEQRAEMHNRADQWTRALADQLESTPEPAAEPPGSELLDEATSAAIRAADRDHGGFGTSGPKFPQPGRIDLLLRTYARTGRSEPLRVAREALDAMADGGLYDQVGGGFHRYCTDREWVVPHFEKMLYDNAELARLYLAGYQATGETRYALIAQETFAFVEREMTHPDGAFYSTLDAESLTPESRRESGEAGERSEGAFYVWTPEEVHEVLPEADAELICDRYGIKSGGNFEGGTTVLTVEETVDDLAEAHDLDADEVQARLHDARAKLYVAREERPRPPRDEKVLAGWNGLMISAFARGARVLDEVLADRAVDALSFVREHLWDAETSRLARRYKDHDVKGDGYLEDYAFLARSAFETYQATGDVDHLAFALDLADVVVEEFYDAEAGTIYFTPASGEDLVARPQEARDQSTPSSLGVAVAVLLDLDGFTDADFLDVVEDVLSTHADSVRGSPLEHVSLALAADGYERGALELTVAAEEVPEDWWEALASRYLPDAVLARRPPTEAGMDEWLDRLGIEEVPPVWRGRTAVDDEPTVYACRAFSCSPPETDVRAALDWAENELGD